MSGEIKRDSVLESVQKYLKRLQAVTSGALSLDSTGARNKLLQIVSNTNGTSNVINELWKGLKNNFGGIENGHWQPSVAANKNLPASSVVTEQQLKSTFNNAANKAVETSMQALGLTPNTNLPKLLEQYSTPSIDFENGTQAGLASLGLNLPALTSAISPSVQNIMNDATQQMQSAMLGATNNIDVNKSATSSNWVIREDPFVGTAGRTQDMQELFGTEGRFESAFDLSKVQEGNSGLQVEATDGSLELAAGQMLTLEEQKTLAAYALYSVPKFYIPPMLVVNDEKSFQAVGGDNGGTSNLKCFIFLSIGNLAIEDATYPRNTPILKVPDADIDAVQDLGFGSGTIKVSGVLWGEAGYVRLQSLKELCKTRRALIWTSQETGAWLVFPQNVPGTNTQADTPGQYKFDFTLICVGKLKEDGRVKTINKQRLLAVERKFKQETAILMSGANQFKLMSSKANSERNLGYVWDPAIGGYRQKEVNGPALGELIPDPKLTPKTTGQGSPLNVDDILAPPALPEFAYGDSAFKEDIWRHNKEDYENVRKQHAIMRERRRIQEKTAEEVKVIAQSKSPQDVATALKDLKQRRPDLYTPIKYTPLPATEMALIPDNDTNLQYEIKYDMAFNQRGLIGLSPSELYYWIYAIELELQELEYIRPDRVLSEALEILKITWTFTDYEYLRGLYQQMLRDIFGELTRRTLPLRDAAKTPSKLYSEELYDEKKLSVYYQTNIKLAQQQGDYPSFSAKPGRFPTTIVSHTMHKKTPQAPSLPEIKTTTNNNRWLPLKTKILKRADE